MENARRINVSPEKSNIYFSLHEKHSVEGFVEKVVAICIQKGQLAPKLLILCRKYDACHMGLSVL